MATKNRLSRGLTTIARHGRQSWCSTAAKLAAGVFGRSHALIADAAESTADILSSLIVWRGVVVASAPADREHPYGHGKAEPLAAGIVSIMLLIATAASLRQSRSNKSPSRAMNPLPSPSPCFWP